MGRPPLRSRQEVLAAARAVFSQHGFEGATLAAIARRVGLSPAALLRHAPTKEALFAAAMARTEGEMALPMDELARTPGDADPRGVLRRLGQAFVPFIDERLGEVIAAWLRARSQGDALPENGLPERLLPFDPRQAPNPPQRAVALLEDYFRRAGRAGRLRVRDPRAAALLFLGSLHSYVVLHRIARIFDPPLPLDLYLDTVIDVWTTGAIRAGRTARPAPRKRKPR
jgi:AcrR family transcriptional regulator